LPSPPLQPPPFTCTLSITISLTLTRTLTSFSPVTLPRVVTLSRFLIWQVLKAIHQEMIFPAVMALRTSVYTVLPYKDVKGEWRVRIELRKDEVRLTHPHMAWT
jgi:hypothetical protein